MTSDILIQIKIRVSSHLDAAHFKYTQTGKGLSEGPIG